MSLRGLYIEDDDNNITVYKELFKQEGFEIFSISKLPLNPKDVYSLVMEVEPDFLLVDHELNKKVAYTGYDALCEIRKQDSTIFAVLLTNFPVQDFNKEFGIYDLEVGKRDLGEDSKLEEISTKIRRACMRVAEAEALGNADESRKFVEGSLEILRQIHKKVTESV